MSARPIIDAGPGLNFFSVNKGRLLFSVLGALSMPETVHQEMLSKAHRDERFAPAATVLKKLPLTLLEVLPDDATSPLCDAVGRIGNLPMEQRIHHPKDLGEMMVIAHAVVVAEAGADVLVLIDDGGGRRLADVEIRRLQRKQQAGEAVGNIGLISSLTVLERAAGGEYLPGRAELRALYARLRGLDDGLPPIESTGLLSLRCWPSSRG